MEPCCTGVFGKFGHNTLANDVLEQFSTNTCHGDRPVVRNRLADDFFENRASLASTHSSGSGSSGAVVKAACLENRRSRVRTPLCFKFQRNKMVLPRSLVKT